MVLWEITLGTAYFLGLRRTYRLASRIQRRVISPKHPKIRDFAHRRTRAVFDTAVSVHKNIQQRDMYLGRNHGNWILRRLDRMKPSAKYSSSAPKNGSSSGMSMTKQVTDKAPGGAESALRKAEDVVTEMLSKGFILGKDAVNKAKGFDEKHQLTSTAAEKVFSFDKKIGLTEKISVGTSSVSEKVREVDQKFQVSEKTKSAFAAAEQTVSNAGSAIMKNRYVFTSAAWVSGALNKVAKAAGEVGQKTKEKVGMVEEEKNKKIEDDYAHVLSESPKASEPSGHEPVKGLIL